MQLVGLVGQSGVGKSTIANYFRNNYSYKIVPFAKPLKESLSVLTGLEMKYFTDPELKEKQIEGLNYSPRELMQKFGTDFVRNTVDSNFWIWRMKQYLDNTDDEYVIVDDIRFRNEAELIKDYNGIIIHIERDFEPLTKHTSHESEKQLEQEVGEFSVNANFGKVNACETVAKIIANHFIMKGIIGDKNER